MNSPTTNRLPSDLFDALTRWTNRQAEPNDQDTILDGTDALLHALSPEKGCEGYEAATEPYREGDVVEINGKLTAVRNGSVHITSNWCITLGAAIALGARILRPKPDPLGPLTEGELPRVKQYLRLSSDSGTVRILAVHDDSRWWGTIIESGHYRTFTASDLLKMRPAFTDDAKALGRAVRGGQ